MYNETVMDHFVNPRNAGRLPEADARGETGNPADGDRITIEIRVVNMRLAAVGFQTFGCAAAIAASSMLTEMATGKTLAEARLINNEMVAEALGGLPPQKVTCSNIAADALQNALDVYEQAHPSTEQDRSEEPSEADCRENAAQRAKEQAADLKPEEVQRFLRQIIMPQISGGGQQRLLTSHVMVWAPGLAWVDLALAYLAAVGFGRVTCLMAHVPAANDPLMTHFQEIHPAVRWQMKPLNTTEIKESPHLMLRVGPAAFLKETQPLWQQQVSRWTSPSPETAGEKETRACLTVMLEEWKGQLFWETPSPVEGYISKTEEEKSTTLTLGMTLSALFAGTQAVVELVKKRLHIGKQLTEIFRYDLETMAFWEGPDEGWKGAGVEGSEGDLPPEKTDAEKAAVSRDDDQHQQRLSDEAWHQRLAGGRVLVVGSGGLGSPAAYALARAGVGTLGLVDDDTVDLSNLNRQILHATPRLGMPKVTSAAQTLRHINQQMTLQTHYQRFSEENADRLLEQYDLVVDGLDNLPSRYVLNEAAVKAGKPYVQAGVLAFYGQSTTVVPGKGPCYACLFPPEDSGGRGPTCEETGVLGPVPGVMGVLEAIEAIRLLAQQPPLRMGKLLMVDVLETEFTVIHLERDENCFCIHSAPVNEK